LKEIMSNGFSEMNSSEKNMDRFAQHGSSKKVTENNNTSLQEDMVSLKVGFTSKMHQQKDIMYNSHKMNAGNESGSLTETGKIEDAGKQH